MTNEVAQTLRTRLESLGFSDTKQEHPWNLLSMELKLPNELGDLTVWGQDQEWLTDAHVQWSQGYEETVTIVTTADVEVVMKAVNAFRTFIQTLEKG